MSERVRVAFLMQRTDYDSLKTAADADGLTVSGLLRRALATHRYVTEIRQRGAHLLIEEAGTQREVIFQ